MPDQGSASSILATWGYTHYTTISVSFCLILFCIIHNNYHMAKKDKGNRYDLTNINCNKGNNIFFVSVLKVCPGLICSGGIRPGGICPWGKCPGGTSLGGYVLELNKAYINRHITIGILPIWWLAFKGYQCCIC